MAIAELVTHHVKVREVGKVAWKFLSPKGTTRLRIHALQFTADGAQKLIDENADDNPEWEFKATAI
jgi:hypothetical protein